MPRFYFHTENGGSHPDEEGVVLSGLDEARHEAARALGEMVRDQPDTFWIQGGLRLTVTDDRGLVLFVLDAVPTIAPSGGTADDAPRHHRPESAAPL